MKRETIPNIIAIIPARYGSTRFPGKMLAEINGKPLIQCVYENAKKCSLLKHVIIATDDERIFDKVVGFGGEAVMTPVECRTGTDRIAVALSLNPQLQHCDIILNVQGDEPHLENEVMVQVIEALIADPEAALSTAVVPIKHKEDALNPNVVKCILDERNNAIYFSRGLIPYGHKGYQPTTSYYAHLGIYCYRREFLVHYEELEPTPLQLAEDLEQLKVIEHGYRIKAAIVNSNSFGIDTPEDLKSY